ncbi:MAG: flagellar export protein FliJ [Spirochaetaceae bacterium]|jgi:flagellar FliJ protein|nr:flagellar export protein FliJ [Spirochaetaceae bacterium]
MKRFAFGLEKVLGLRRHRERETETALGKAVGALTALEQRINSAAAERARVSAHPPEARDIPAFDRYILRLEHEKAAFLQEKARAEQKAEEARQVYLEAARDRKIIDKVKERRRGEYCKRTAREETKILDDLASSAKIRAGGEAQQGVIAKNANNTKGGGGGIMRGLMVLLFTGLGAGLFGAGQKEKTFAPLDLSGLPNGIYKGSSENWPVAADVDVLIQEGAIARVVITRHREGLGEKAEAVAERVIASQSLNVDAVSGATLSSITILQAIESALKPPKRLSGS